MSNTLSAHSDNRVAPTSLDRRIKPSLTSNVFWTLSGNVVNAASQWGVLAVMSRMGESSEVGVYAFVLAVTQPIFGFCSLQLREVQVTDVRREYQTADYVLLRLFTTAAAVFIAIGIAFTPFARHVPDGLIIALATIQAIDSIADLFHGYLQSKESMKRITTTLLIRGPATLVAFAITYNQTENLTKSVLAMFLARCVVFMLFDLTAFIAELTASRETLEWRFNPRLQLRMLSTALPFAMLSMALALRTTIPRYCIYCFSGDRDLGIYAIASTAIAPIQMITHAMYQTAFPRITRHIIDAKHTEMLALIAKLRWACLAIVAISVTLALILGPTLVRLVFSVNHPRLSVIIACLAASTSLHALGKPAGLIARANKQIAILMMIHFIGLLLLLGLCLQFAEKEGLIGITVAQCAATLVTVSALSQVTRLQIKQLTT